MFLVWNHLWIFLNETNVNDGNKQFRLKYYLRSQLLLLPSTAGLAKEHSPLVKVVLGWNQLWIFLNKSGYI